MKGFSLFVLAILGSLTAAWGQRQDTNDGNILSFTVPSDNHFLDRYVENVSFSLRDDTVSSVRLIPRKDDTAYLNREFLKVPFGEPSFFFDLGYEADRLVFRKKYPEIPTPIIPRIDVNDNFELIDEDKLYSIVWLRFFRDSTEFTYQWGDNLGKDKYLFGRPSRYIGDISKMAADIAGEMKAASIEKPFDSILVF